MRRRCTCKACFEILPYWGEFQALLYIICYHISEKMDEMAVLGFGDIGDTHFL